MKIIYKLYGAKRPEQQQPEFIREYDKLAPAIDDGREIIRDAEDGKGELTYVEIRWDGRFCWCAWKRPKTLMSVANLLDD